MKSLRAIGRWFYQNVIWDPSPAARRGGSGILWGARKILLVLALTAFLTWREWVEHHPPEIAVVAVIHFVFVMLLVAAAVRGWQWISGAKGNPSAS
ncbi:MAG TPA: hypothetical protein VKV39_12120 [Candidatus Sulfotelmatobacter sp.]|nr:hypothetical protein [Candidatus Sulfotelmatobacter sp.]